MIAIGLIGCGGVAGMHARAIARLSDRCRLDAVFDQNPAQAERMASDYPGVVVTQDVDALLARNIQAVIIGVPNRFHQEYVTRAAERGIAVLSEKPASDTLEGAYRMMETTQRFGVVNMIGFENRHHIGVQKLQQVTRQGLLGDIYAYREVCSGARLANPEIGMEWRMRDTISGGGAVADFGSHSLDMATWLLEDRCGAVVNLVGAQGIFVKRDGRYPTNDDMTVVTGRFASGALLSIIDSRVGPGLYQVEIYGSEGYAQFDIRKASELTVQFYRPGRELPVWDEAEPADTFFEQLKVFVDAVANHRQVEPNMSTAYKVQRLIEMARTNSV